MLRRKTKEVKEKNLKDTNSKYPGQYPNPGLVKLDKADMNISVFFREEHPKKKETVRQESNRR